MIPDYAALIEALTDGDVEYVIVGAVALVLHGSARVTRDLDICYSRDAVNIARLATALEPMAPALRDAPEGLPFVLDAATIRAGLNFTLTSTAGDIDLFGELTGIGDFAVVRRLSEPMPIYDREVRVLGLEGLERAKRAAGRLKDLADLAEILDIRKRQGTESTGTRGRLLISRMADQTKLRQFPQTLDARIRGAILGKKLIEVTYNGRLRRAEPHDYGQINGVDRLLIFQLDKNVWRMLDVPKIEALTVLDETFRGSRGSAHESHHRWDSIYLRVK